MKLGKEIDLLRSYPKTKRDPAARAESKTEKDSEIAKQFGKDFFDGDRRHGYGGFSYNPKYWGEVVKDLKEFYCLTEESTVLDVGCAKGFMIHDLIKLIPGIKVEGVDISDYATDNCMPSVSGLVKAADARSLPYPDKSFDLVVSINTLHNLTLTDFRVGLKEIIRVSKKSAFITVDAWNTDEEKEAMFNWNLTAQTILSTDEWKKVLEEEGYSGDFFWFLP